jgi:hypothetical protein
MLDALKEIYREMDPQTGMFPATWTCRGCKKPLNATGGRPAELYAGTYTGLCYDCEGAGPFVLSIYPLDGARAMSYPPSCPSWRRDRETYTAYEDCGTCKGSGVEGMTYANWSTHRNYCQACSTRFHGHPIRARRGDRGSALVKAADAVYQAELERIARLTLPKKPRKKDLNAAKAAASRSPRFLAIRNEILARYERARERLRYYDEPM